MTQAEKTEAVITEAYSRATLAEITGQVEIHARDLAEKLDAVLAMLEPGSGQVGREEDAKTVCLTLMEWRLLEEVHDKARAIIEPRP